jgi:hypothetical protein
MTTRLMGLCLLLALAGERLHAQQVSGVTLEAGTGRALSFVEVAVLDGRKVLSYAVSDQQGQFKVPISRSGTFKLRATRIGYRAFISDEIAVAADEDVRTELQLAVDAVPVEPLGGKARRDRTFPYARANRKTQRRGVERSADDGAGC